MKTLAIVSSFSESCGNAAFTKVLRDSIQYYTDVVVTVVELDLSLLQSIDRGIRKQADQHIESLVAQLAEFDAVNIQLEAGLYGTLPHDIVRRVKSLVRANSNTSVTLHSPRLMPPANSTTRSGIKNLMKLKLITGIKQILAGTAANIHVRINHRLLRACIKYKCRLIVHTKRAKQQIHNFYNYSKVDVHPLKLVAENFSPDGNVLAELKKGLALKDDNIIIGMFGYLSAYKGHIDALAALERLPANFKLMIFGRQHPQTLQTNGTVDSYLKNLTEKVSRNKKLQSRVFFMGELSDDDFQSVVANVDVVWLPYYENGQDGSGIASICLDLASRVLCSTSFAFDELFKLTPYKNAQRFDIGNYLEMGSKTEIMMRTPAPSQPFSSSDQYSIRQQALLYVGKADWQEN
jgi:glycosyltransferase involved in cell wall biosynthesis